MSPSCRPVISRSQATADYDAGGQAKLSHNFNNAINSPEFTYGEVYPQGGADQMEHEMPLLDTAATDQYYTNSSNSEFADPIEVFTSHGRQWHMYFTDTNDVYYLDMKNEHSQWEDPREHGVVHFGVTIDIAPPDSPVKPYESAPPVSPAPRRSNAPSPSKLSTMSPRTKNEAKKSLIDDDSSPPETVTTKVSGYDMSSQSSVLSEITHRTKAPLLFHSISSSDEESEFSIRTVTNNRRKQVPAGEMRTFSRGNNSSFSSSSNNSSVNNINLSLEKEMKDNDAAKVFAAEIDISNNNKSNRSAEAARDDKAQVVLRNTWTSVQQQQQVQQPEDAPPSSSQSNGRDKSSTESQRRTSEPLEKTTLNDAELEPYVTMIKSGKTLQEVRILLEEKGYNQQVIMQVINVADTLLLEDSESSEMDTAIIPITTKGIAAMTLSANTAAPTANLDTLKDDPRFAKYVRMFRMGVPAMSVITKMKMEHAEESQVKEMQLALGLQLSGEDNGSKSSKGWAALNDPVQLERLKNSIWAAYTNNSSGNNGGESMEGIAEQELKELEQLFQHPVAADKNHPVVDKITALQTNAKAAYSLHVLESKRAQNIVIGLVPFKSIGSYIEVIKAVCSMNDCDGQLTSDHLENFRYLLPTESEVKLSFKLKKGASHPAEQFMQAVLLFYPELPLRLNIFITCVNFPLCVEELEYKFMMITSVINQVSERLRGREREK